MTTKKLQVQEARLLAGGLGARSPHPKPAQAATPRKNGGMRGRRPHGQKAHTLAFMGALTALCLLPSVSQANPFEVFGAGARGAAMGGALTAESMDFAALHYNVGAMGFVERPTASVGFMMGVDDAQIRLKARPDGYDLPNLGRNSAAIPSDFRLRTRSDTEGLLDTYGVYMGGVASLGFENLRIGALIFLPVNRIGLQQTHFPDEREQYFSNKLHFELLGERLQRQIIMVGAAYKVAPWLSVGAGISFLPQSIGVNQVYLDNPTDQSNTDLVIQNDQTGRIAPMVGLKMLVGERLKVGLAWRGELFFSLKGSNEIQIRGFQEVEGEFPVVQEFRVVQNYTPHELALGVSYNEDNYVVTIDVVRALWSRYLNHQGERVEGFDDTFGFRLGTEYEYSDAVLLRAGFGFTPTPVPDQSGRTNYVDNDRAQFSLGAGHPLRLFGSNVEFSWYMQFQYLLPRDTDKDVADVFAGCAPGVQTLCDELPDDEPDPITGELVPEHAGLQTGNPGFPGFQSFGVILSVGADLRWKF